MPELRAGRLLVATPILDDPNFRRTVVLLCSHDEHGSFGLVLNRPLEATVADLAPEWGRLAAPPPVLFAGGPVDRVQAFALARSDQAAEESWWTAILEGIGLVGFDGDPSALDGIEEARIFVGYAGWGAGQLEAEVEEEAWFVVDAHPNDMFTAAPARLWHEVLGRQRGELSLYRHFPPEPWLN
ncbi:MAG: YqgE/AlgH family protein [Dehalococcoidia bacterium]|nr:YqgE/AlgH family protein [Dehalococcoidia bacterium]